MPTIVIVHRSGIQLTVESIHHDPVKRIEVDGEAVYTDTMFEQLKDLHNLLGSMLRVPEVPRTQPECLLGMPVDHLALGERSAACIRRAGIQTIGELIARSTGDLLVLTNFGEKSLGELMMKLSRYGLALSNTDYHLGRD